MSTKCGGDCAGHIGGHQPIASTILIQPDLKYGMCPPRGRFYYRCNNNGYICRRMIRPHPVHRCAKLLRLTAQKKKGAEAPFLPATSRGGYARSVISSRR